MKPLINALRFACGAFVGFVCSTILIGHYAVSGPLEVRTIERDICSVSAPEMREVIFAAYTLGQQEKYDDIGLKRLSVYDIEVLLK